MSKIKFAKLTTDTIFVDRSRAYGIDELPLSSSANPLSEEDFLLGTNKGKDSYLLTQMRLSTLNACKARIEDYQQQQQKKEAEEERHKKFTNGLLGI